MKAGFKKRLAAYLLDLVVIAVVLGIIVGIKEKDQKVMRLRSDFNIVNELYASNEIKFQDYFDRFTTLHQQIDQECVCYLIFNILFVLGYFILLPYIWNGQTIGKRIMKIGVVSKTEQKVTIANYLIRNIVVNGLGYMILSLLFLYLLSNKMYFIFTSILCFIQIILVIISISMILYRRDKRSLHDILSGTDVVLMAGREVMV